MAPPVLRNANEHALSWTNGIRVARVDQQARVTAET
jgi:hypothetical protein